MKEQDKKEFERLLRLSKPTSTGFVRGDTEGGLRMRKGHLCDAIQIAVDMYNNAEGNAKARTKIEEVIYGLTERMEEVAEDNLRRKGEVYTINRTEPYRDRVDSTKPQQERARISKGLVDAASKFCTTPDNLVRKAAKLVRYRTELIGKMDKEIGDGHTSNGRTTESERSH